MMSGNRSLEKIHKAHEAKWAAVQAYKKTIEAELRPGDRLAYKHGENLIECEFVDTRGEDVLVRGRAGTEYQIGAYRIEVIYRSET